MALKAGRVADFSASLAEAMEQALREEWQAVKGVALPGQGEQDRRLLLVAVARGLFSYLKLHEDDLLDRITLQVDDGFGTGTTQAYLVTQLELDL